MSKQTKYETLYQQTKDAMETHQSERVLEFIASIRAINPPEKQKAFCEAIHAETLLLLAAQRGLDAVVQGFIELRIRNTTHYDNKEKNQAAGMAGFTALHFLVRDNKTELAEQLLSYNAYPKSPSLLQLAFDHENVDLCQALGRGNEHTTAEERYHLELLTINKILIQTQISYSNTEHTCLAVFANHSTPGDENLRQIYTNRALRQTFESCFLNGLRLGRIIKLANLLLQTWSDDARLWEDVRLEVKTEFTFTFSSDSVFIDCINRLAHRCSQADAACLSARPEKFLDYLENIAAGDASPKTDAAKAILRKHRYMNGTLLTTFNEEDFDDVLKLAGILWKKTAFIGERSDEDISERLERVRTHDGDTPLERFCNYLVDAGGNTNANSLKCALAKALTVSNDRDGTLVAELIDALTDFIRTPKISRSTSWSTGLGPSLLGGTRGDKNRRHSIDTTGTGAAPAPGAG